MTTEKFRITHHTTTEFDFWDRIRILLGKKFHTTSYIYVDKEVSIITPDEAKSYVEPLFQKRQKGGMEEVNYMDFEKQPFPAKLSPENAVWDDSHLNTDSK